MDPPHLASELRVAVGQLARRLRAEHRLPLAQGAVLARLEREGTRSIGELAAAEQVRPQSMAQTVTDMEAAGLVARRSDPADLRRALIEPTEAGRAALAADRRQREGWLAGAIEETLTREEQRVLGRAVELLRRLAERR